MAAAAGSGIGKYWTALGSALLAGAVAARYVLKGAIVSQPQGKEKATAKAGADAKADGAGAGAGVAADGKDLDVLRGLITAHNDFPSKGVVFRDVFPILRDPVALELLLTRLISHVQQTYGRVDAIVGLDSRGFLFGPTLATRLGAAFVPIRKAGKLPGECLRVSYAKEYGKDEFDIQKQSLAAGARVVIVDDLLATGGTMAAAIDLVKRAGAVPLECLVVIELPDLGGRKKLLPVPTHTVLQY